ncbi:MAG TPA: hypothetical protein VFU97_24455 [Xanthobacteraceae bacterium]|nr:hypothetical protein [Xanthobacteraceae bacterium]
MAKALGFRPDPTGGYHFDTPDGGSLYAIGDAADQEAANRMANGFDPSVTSGPAPTNPAITGALAPGDDQRTADLSDSIRAQLGVPNGGAPNILDAGGPSGPAVDPRVEAARQKAAAAAQARDRSASNLLGIEGPAGPNPLDAAPPPTDPRILEARAKAAKEGAAKGAAGGVPGAAPVPGVTPGVGGGPSPYPAPHMTQGGFTPATRTVEGPAPIPEEVKQAQEESRFTKEGAIQKAAEVGKDLAQEQYATHVNYQNELARMDAEHTQLERQKQKEIDDHMAYADRMAKDAASGKIDPDHVWQDRSKPMSIIGAMLLGAAGQGRQALDSINQMIDTDIKAQQLNLQNKRASAGEAQNLVHIAQKQFGDSQSQYLAARGAKIQSLMSELETEAAKYKGTQAEINANAAIGDLQKEYADNQQKFALLTQEKTTFKYAPPQMVGGPPPTPVLKDDERFLQLPDGTTIHASGKEELGRWSETLSAADRVKRNVDEASQLLATPGFTDAKRINVLINQAVNSMGPLSTGGARASSLAELEKLSKQLETGDTISHDLSGQTRAALSALRDEADAAQNRIFNSARRYSQEIPDKSGTFVHVPLPQQPARREKLDLQPEKPE